LVLGPRQTDSADVCWKRQMQLLTCMSTMYRTVLHVLCCAHSCMHTLQLQYIGRQPAAARSAAAAASPRLARARHGRRLSHMMYSTSAARDRHLM